LKTERVTIDRRFRGPPDSGNGGYVAGLLARALGGSDCVVTLHLPPPLGQEMEIRATDDGVALFDDERLVASALPGKPDIDVPPPPSLEQAREADQRFVGLTRHNFPGCFVCGPDRSEGDGLRIFTGPMASGRVAGSWTPDGNLADAKGMVRSEFLWAGLDCPGYFSVEQAAGLALLGRMTASVERTPAAGEPLIVTGWPIASDGRKHHVGTALHDARGNLVACARSTWISPPA
jgi:hypothetical protein